MQELAERDHPAPAGPFPNMTGVIDPKLIVHHSGGPYLGARRAANVALTAEDCALGGPEHGDPNTACLQVDVRFFNHYSDLWAVEGGQTQFVGSWGPDHELYVVSVFGRLSLVTTAESQLAPIEVPWRTFQVDATNGQIAMTGGAPLPEHFSGVQTFQAPSRAGG